MQYSASMFSNIFGHIMKQYTLVCACHYRTNKRTDAKGISNRLTFPGFKRRLFSRYAKGNICERISLATSFGPMLEHEVLSTVYKQLKICPC